jgi:hypothetical protein
MQRVRPRTRHLIKPARPSALIDAVRAVLE